MSLDGDYTLYVNYECSTRDPGEEKSIIDKVDKMRLINPNIPVSLDIWSWKTVSGPEWRKLPKYDQDQARLCPIVTARNMSREYAMTTGSSHLLFMDADIKPPLDIIPKLLETGYDAVGGLTHGRGVHSHLPYLQGEKRKFTQGDPPYPMVEAEHSNIGFCMISRKLFSRIAFRWGQSDYPDGRSMVTSDDPAFHLDAFKMFGDWMKIRMDVIGEHCGDLQETDISQF